MSRSVEGDVLVDTCRFYPIPQGLAGHAFLKPSNTLPVVASPISSMAS